MWRFASLKLIEVVLLVTCITLLFVTGPLCSYGVGMPNGPPVKGAILAEDNNTVAYDVGDSMGELNDEESLEQRVLLVHKVQKRSLLEHLCSGAYTWPCSGLLANSSDERHLTGFYSCVKVSLLDSRGMLGEDVPPHQRVIGLRWWAITMLLINFVLVTYYMIVNTMHRIPCSAVASRTTHAISFVLWTLSATVIMILHCGWSNFFAYEKPEPVFPTNWIVFLAFALLALILLGAEIVSPPAHDFGDSKPMGYAPAPTNETEYINSIIRQLEDQNQASEP